MPGFVDTHDHFWQSLIRGCAADGDLLVWLGRCVRPLRTPLFSESDAYAAVRLSTTGLINTGVTTVVDWSHAFNPAFVRDNLRALNDAGLRYAFAMIGTAADGSDIKAAKAAFIDPNPLGTLQVAATPRPGAVSGNTAVATAVAKALGVKLHFHLNEHPDERVDDPFGILEAAGAFDLGLDLHAAHAIHMTDAEIAQLAALGASVSHQPLSNMRLASGIMRYPDFQAAGIRLSLGLDGGTNDTIDAFNTIRAAVGLQRAKAVDEHASPTVPEVLRAATLDGAETLDLARRIGSLTPEQASGRHRHRSARGALRARAPAGKSDRVQRPAAERHVGVRCRPHAQGGRQGHRCDRARADRGGAERDRPYRAPAPAVTALPVRVGPARGRSGSA
jgi:5-methylthioadenosine/S-adenosylhomocysteine deaminase